MEIYEDEVLRRHGLWPVESYDTWQLRTNEGLARISTVSMCASPSISFISLPHSSNLISSDILSLFPLPIFLYARQAIGDDWRRLVPNGQSTNVCVCVIPTQLQQSLAYFTLLHILSRRFVSSLSSHAHSFLASERVRARRERERERTFRTLLLTRASLSLSLSAIKR